MRNDFKTGAIEAFENYFLRSCWHNSFLLDECKKNACNYIVINGTESVEEIKEKILLITGYEE